MRGWHRPFPTSNREELNAEGGKRLYIRVNGTPIEYSTDVGGFIYREGGWIYGHNRDRAWSVPEAAVVGISEV